MADRLKISLSALPETGLRLEETIPVRQLQPAQGDTPPVSEVLLRGELSPMGESYFFRGWLEGVFHGLCDRCLEKAEVPFKQELMWHFEEGPPPLESGLEAEECAKWAEMEEEEAQFVREECRTYQHNVIDLTPHLWEELVLLAPTKLYCREECLGLCPVCGGNRNVKHCACEEEQAPSSASFAELAELFPDLAPKKKEE